MKVFILRKEGENSAKILALSLQRQFEREGIETEISSNINLLNRLVSFSNNNLSLHFWLSEKIHNYRKDRELIRQLKKADAIVICECIPNAFWKRLYNVEKLKKITRKPVLLYEVYYLANAPTQMQNLEANNDALLSRYNGHLYISPVTEIRKNDDQNAYCVGIVAKEWNLEASPKKELIALVDFEQPGFEQYRQEQIKMLAIAGIKYISLESRYTIEEIREIYKQVSIFFVQFPEAFGLPILECLCTGAQIFTPDSSWPMSWRLDDNPQVHGPGMLPGCFTVYDGSEDLLARLLDFKNNFNPVSTPQKVFGLFRKNYPSFYEGDEAELRRLVHFLETRE